MLELAKTLDGDEATGAKLVARALEEPLKQIAVNAGLEGGVIVEKVRSLKGANGLNAATGEYEDLVKAGVIDAAKVTRSALQNAASIAALFLTTEAVVADKPEEKGAGGMPVAACPTWAAWAAWATSEPPLHAPTELRRRGRPPGAFASRASRTRCPRDLDLGASIPALPGRYNSDVRAVRPHRQMRSPHSSSGPHASSRSPHACGSGSREPAARSDAPDAIGVSKPSRSDRRVGSTRRTRRRPPA